MFVCLFVQLYFGSNGGISHYSDEYAALDSSSGIPQYNRCRCTFNKQTYELTEKTQNINKISMSCKVQIQGHRKFWYMLTHPVTRIYSYVRTHRTFSYDI